MEAVLCGSTMRKEEAVALLLERKFNEAFNLMVKEMERLENLLVSPRMHKEYLLCSATLNQCLSLMGNRRMKKL